MKENVVELLKIADILGIYFICPIASIFIELTVRKKRQAEINKVNVAIKWLTFFVMGIGAFVAGFMQSFIPSFTATMLQVPEDSYIVIRELGYAALGTGFVGILSLKYKHWRIPVSIARGIFILCCTLNHFTRLDVVNFAEILAIVADIWIVAVAAFVIINNKQTLSKRKI